MKSYPPVAPSCCYYTRAPGLGAGAGASTGAPVTVNTPRGTLPFTGAWVSVMILIAVVLLACGTYLVRRAGRR